ncbi:MAG: ATP-binding protein [Bacteroidia bacterium]|nr:ATP-binding protein [Bacteroidia bacterium]
MIPRQAAAKLRVLAAQFRSVAVIGPRQSGKTTLSRACFPDKPYASLETPETRRFALDDPKGFLASYPDGAILDEIQRAPELLSWLQQRLDEDGRRGLFILTGSNNFLLLEQITQSLAGRAAYLDLLPLSFSEWHPTLGSQPPLDEVLLKGGYPAILAEGADPQDWFAAYVRTYVERDVRQIKNLGNLLAFERLLALCAGRVGQLLNTSHLANELGVDVKTVQSWLGILQASYIIHLLPPYFQNFSKRIVKTPKLYFCDTGLAAYLLRIGDTRALGLHPLRGALFENFILNELLKNRLNQGLRSNLYFWRDQGGHELDVLIDEGDQVIPVEIKSGQTVHQDFFKGLQYWRALTGRDTAGRIYYGGDSGQQRSGGDQVRSWRHLAPDE